MSKIIELFQEILLIIHSSMNKEDRASKMKICIEKIKQNKNETIEVI